MSFEVIHADVLNPYGYGAKVIVNIENVDGSWSQSLSGAMGKKWKGLKKDFKKWHKLTKKGKVSPPLAMGETRFFEVTEHSWFGYQKGPRIWVATIICMESGASGMGGYRRDFRYTSFADGFKRVKSFAIAHCASVHMPKVGYQYGGASWEIIKELASRISEPRLVTIAYA